MQGLLAVRFEAAGWRPYHKDTDSDHCADADAAAAAAAALAAPDGGGIGAGSGARKGGVGDEATAQ